MELRASKIQEEIKEIDVKISNAVEEIKRLNAAKEELTGKENEMISEAIRIFKSECVDRIKSLNGTYWEVRHSPKEKRYAYIKEILYMHEINHAVESAIDILKDEYNNPYFYTETIKHCVAVLMSSFSCSRYLHFHGLMLGGSNDLSHDEYLTTEGGILLEDLVYRDNKPTRAREMSKEEFDNIYKQILGRFDNIHNT